MVAHFHELLTTGDIAIGDRLAIDQQHDLLRPRRRCNRRNGSNDESGQPKTSG
jgi:hypothetical protein